MALGATPARAIRTIAVPGVLLTGVGVAMGLLVARSAVFALRGFVWGIAPTDLVTFVSVGLMFLVLAAAASLLPALRILRVDPANTLRQE
jgi:ABC-type antimicrobial peptide transport system permease subunit